MCAIRGLNPKETAVALRMADGTVKTHRNAIVRATGSASWEAALGKFVHCATGAAEGDPDTLSMIPVAKKTPPKK